MIVKFNKDILNQLWKPNNSVGKGENGNVTIIGGSELFQGAPVLAAIAASRLVENVFLATPAEDKEIVIKVELFSKLRSVIWVPREDSEAYIEKSDAVLIGPGLMRFHHESSKLEVLSSSVYDGDGTLTRSITKYFLQKFPVKNWVIDGGSLQVMEADWIPKNAILTCNEKEFEMLFSTSPLTPALPVGRPLHNHGVGNQRGEVVALFAKKHNCIIVLKGVRTYVSDGETTYEIGGGNAGLGKGGTGDVQAGLTVGLLAKNPPLLAAAAAAMVIKATAEELYSRMGYNFNADDVSNEVFGTLHKLTA